MIVHHVRTTTGTLVITLRYVVSDVGCARFDFLDSTGTLFLTAAVDGPGATQVRDGTGHQLPRPSIDGVSMEAKSPVDPVIHTIGGGAVMVSCRVGENPVWIVDDYENHSRHFILGCNAELFLHVNLDASGNVTLTEKNREHAILRTVRRDATGALLGDDVAVQPVEGANGIGRPTGKLSG